MKKLKKIENYSVAILYIATILGLGIGFFGNVLNSRLLSKELFGDWKYLQNFLMMISYFVNFGFFSSGGRLIAATNNNTKIGIFKGYMMYLCIAGLIVIVLVTVLTGLFWHKMLNESLFHLALFMFPLFIIHPLTFYFESTFQAERKLISLSIYKILPALLYIALLYTFKKYSQGSIYYNAILFYGSTFIVYLIFLLKDKPIFKRKTPEWDQLISQNKTYGIHIYYGGICSVGSGYLVPILIGFFNINNVEVGHFSLALSFIVPLSFLPSIVGTSYYKQFITEPNIPISAFKKVVLPSLALLIVMLFTIDYFIDFFLGPKFKEVSYLIKVGALGAILNGLGDFVNKFLQAKGESVYLKKVSIMVGIVQIVFSLVLIKLFSSTGAIVAKSLGSLVFFVSLYIFYYRKYIIQKSKGVLIPDME